MNKRQLQYRLHAEHEMANSDSNTYTAKSGQKTTRACSFILAGGINSYTTMISIFPINSKPNMGGQSHRFLLHTSSRAAVVKQIKAAPYTLCNPIKRYSKGSDDGREDFLHLAKAKDVPATDQEKAPSLEDEFERVAEEKSKAREKVKGAKQGVASQTTEKVYDGAEEATISGSKVESAKNRYMQDAT